MDNQGNMPKLCLIDKDKEVRPLTLTECVQGNLLNEESQSASFASGSAENRTVLIPQHEPTSLEDINRSISRLSGLFEKFVDSTLTKDRPKASDKSSFTIVRPGQRGPDEISPRKRSVDEISITQSHDSFEHLNVSRKRTEGKSSAIRTGAKSPAHNSDVKSSKIQKMDAKSSSNNFLDDSSTRSRGLDLSSLFRKPSSRSDEGSTRSIDMEEEVLDFVDSEMPALQDKTGPPLVSTKLAQKIKNQWQNSNFNSAMKIFAKYKHPTNLETVMTPPMPKIIRHMPTFKQNTAVRERKLFNTQREIVKATHIMATMADDILQAETTDRAVDTKSVVLKAFDAINVLANASINLSNMRKLNIRHLLNRDVQGLCDSSTKVSEHLFGDEIEKCLKEERESRRISQLAVQQPSSHQFSGARRSYDNNRSPFRERAEPSFLGRGHKARPYRQKRRPYRN